MPRITLAADRMTGPELAAALDELGLTRAGFARLCGVDAGTVYCWLREPDAPKWFPVPQYAETIINLMREREKSDGR